MTPLEVAIILIAHFLKNIPLGKIYTNRAIKQRQLRTGLDKTQRINNIKGRKGFKRCTAIPAKMSTKPHVGEGAIRMRMQGATSSLVTKSTIGNNLTSGGVGLGELPWGTKGGSPIGEGVGDIKA